MPAEYMAFESRGAGRGLAVLASRIRADLIVAGSADGGGTAASQLGAPPTICSTVAEAVMLAPAGYLPPDGPTRLTLAYVHRPQCDEAVERVAQAALRLGVPLRLITFDLRTEDRGRLRDDLALAVRQAWEDSGIEAEAEVAEGHDVAAAWRRPSGCPASCWSARPARTRSRTGCSSGNWR